MKIEQETKPESSSSGGAVDLRAKLLARRKAQSLQLNDSGGNDGSTTKHKVSKMLARGDEGELEEDEDDDDNDYEDIEDEDDENEEADAHMGRGRGREASRVHPLIHYILISFMGIWRGLSKFIMFSFSGI